MYSCQFFNILMKIESSWYLLFCVFFFLTKTSNAYYYSNILGEARLLDISPF